MGPGTPWDQARHGIRHAMGRAVLIPYESVRYANGGSAVAGPPGIGAELRRLRSPGGRRTEIRTLPRLGISYVLGSGTSWHVPWSSHLCGDHGARCWVV